MYAGDLYAHRSDVGTAVPQNPEIASFEGVQKPGLELALEHAKRLNMIIVSQAATITNMSETLAKRRENLNHIADELDALIVRHDVDVDKLVTIARIARNWGNN